MSITFYLSMRCWFVSWVALIVNLLGFKHIGVSLGLAVLLQNAMLFEMGASATSVINWYDGWIRLLNHHSKQLP